MPAPSCRGPGVLLMDEPFSGLDSRLRDSVRADTLSVLRESGATAVIVTHDPEEAMRMSDRIVLMRGGRIVQEGECAGTLRPPESLFVARFFSASERARRRGLLRPRRHPDRGRSPATRHADGACGHRRHPPAGRSLLAAAATTRGGTPGRIMSRHFLGEIELFDVAVEGSDAYLLAKARAGDGLAPGADVRVSFDPRDVLVFAEAE